MPSPASTHAIRRLLAIASPALLTACTPTSSTTSPDPSVTSATPTAPSALATAPPTPSAPTAEASAAPTAPASAVASAVASATASAAAPTASAAPRATAKPVMKSGQRCDPPMRWDGALTPEGIVRVCVGPHTAPGRPLRVEQRDLVAALASRSGWV